jgi:hypothetical protein
VTLSGLGSLGYPNSNFGLHQHYTSHCSPPTLWTSCQSFFGAPVRGKDFVDNNALQHWVHFTADVCDMTRPALHIAKPSTAHATSRDVHEPQSSIISRMSYSSLHRVSIAYAPTLVRNLPSCLYSVAPSIRITFPGPADSVVTNHIGM